MIKIKTIEEINILKEGGKLLSNVLDEVCSLVKPGIGSQDLEDLAVSLIEKNGGRPAFKDYPMGGNIFFPSALCVSINNEVVHGPAVPNRILKSGDIVGLDIGMEWPIQSKKEASEKNRPFNKYSPGGGFYTDMCRTVPVGKVSKEASKIIKISKEALFLGISKAKPGMSINDIGKTIEDFVVKNGFSVVRDLVGHGVGHQAHEEPHVFNYEIGDKNPDNTLLKPGMVIAIEPMINAGRFNVKTTKNTYTFVTSDGLLSSHYEHSIAITEDGNIILTQ